MVSAIDKVKQINQILESKGVSSSWSVRTEREAMNFVVDVLECTLADENWDQAVKEFSNCVLSYTSFMDEEASEYFRHYGD